MNKAERGARAIRAKLFIENAEVQTAFAEIEADIQRDWAEAWTKRKREELWRELNTVHKLRSKLAKYAGQVPKN